ncbi:hypothetical protein [Croceicoccus ponticola]|uniref:hypothetical protein n=1 Tax=Croceicoccus ponticola TaxID=2217664 RepID=UPI000FD919E2|nr:hypothetical protein [Croceicoccus ponticola]
MNIPKWVQRELERTDASRVVVAAVLNIGSEKVDRYRGLGLALSDGKIVASPPAPPPPSSGKYARRNLDGWTDRRDDLPLESREISSWAPSWKSASFHLISRQIDAYPLEHHSAKLLTISASAVENLVDAALVRFRVDQPLDRETESFAADLLFNVHLLREAIGEAHVFDADLSDADFARIQHVDWELLPVGSTDRVLERLASRNPRNPERLRVAGERLRVLDRLGHDGFILGTGKFAGYFGAKFGDRLVALENLEYGNALYVFEADWEILTQLSRTELTRLRDPSVHRLPHLPGWQSAIRKLVRR